MGSKRIFYLFLTMLLTVNITVSQQVQGYQQGSSDDSTRDFWDSKFLKKRPKSKMRVQPAKKPSYRKATESNYENARNLPPLDKGSDKPGFSLLGLTVWKLRPAKPSENDVRIFTHKKKNPKQLEGVTPERVEADTPLAEGTRTRFTIESPNKGYLYVVDREQYADGSMSDPYLIFPSADLNAGNNLISAGRIVEIPAQNDDPSYLELERSRKDQVAEVLTIIVSPQPLNLRTIETERGIQIAKEQFVIWQKQWEAKSERFELETGAGSTWTVKEKEAGANRNQLLTENDPPPQTLYKLNKAETEPVMVTVPIKIAN